MFTQKQLFIIGSSICAVIIFLLVWFIFIKPDTHLTPSGEKIAENKVAFTIKGQAYPKAWAEEFKKQDKRITKELSADNLAQKAWLIEWALDNKKLDLTREEIYKNSESFIAASKRAEKLLPKRKTSKITTSFNSGYMSSTNKNTIKKLHTFTQKNIDDKNLNNKLIAKDKEQISSVIFDLVFNMEPGLKNSTKITPKYIDNLPGTGEVSKVLSHQVNNKDIEAANEQQKEALTKMLNKNVYWFFYTGGKTSTTSGEAVDYSVLEKYREQTKCFGDFGGGVC